MTFYSLKNVTKIGEMLFTKKHEILGETKKSFTKINKISDILFIENVTKIGEKSFTKKIENFSESTKMSLKNHQNWRKFKGIAIIGDNFVENECGLLYVANYT